MLISDFKISLYDIENDKKYKFLNFNRMIDFAYGLNSTFKMSVEIRKGTWVDIDSVLTRKDIDDLMSSKKGVEISFCKCSGDCETVLLKYVF